jgi:hypothetical protein
VHRRSSDLCTIACAQTLFAEYTDVQELISRVVTTTQAVSNEVERMYPYPKRKYAEFSSTATRDSKLYTLNSGVKDPDTLSYVSRLSVAAPMVAYIQFLNNAKNKTLDHALRVASSCSRGRGWRVRGLPSCWAVRSEGPLAPNFLKLPRSSLHQSRTWPAPASNRI